MADFEALLDSAHAHGIKIIIDYVMNHTSNQHPWFTQSANNVNNYRNWYVWSPTNPAFLGPWGQTVWHNLNNSYYYGLFYNGMPDLNYDNAAVKTEMFKVSDFWLNKGVDGFRLDAIKYLDEDGSVLENTPSNFMLLQDFNASYKKTNPNAFAIGEVWSATSSIVPYVENNRLDACFEFGLAGAILTSVNNKNTEAIKNQIKVVAQAYPSLQYGTFLTNHDQDRVYTQLGNDTSKMKLAAAQYLTLPGVPFIYYGEEIGMIGSGADENKRKPMQWTAGTNAGFSTHLPWQTLGTNYTTNNVQTLSANKNSIWNYYQKLIQARNENEALRKGYVLLLANQKNTNIAFARIYNQTAILSVSNFSNTNTTDSLSLGISTLNAGNYQASNLLTGENLGIITINNVGGFDNWAILANTLKASSNLLIKLTNTNTGLQLDKAKLFTMYPNPAQTHLQFNLNTADGDVDLVIYDSNGIQMQSQKINHANHSINIEKLATGVYFVKISNKKFTQIERLLKQ
jgi:glycosidase